MSHPDALVIALWCLGAFLCGSVPFGLLIVKALGKGDVREHGSGNIGATNVSRVAGKSVGVVTLLLDMAKGFLPVWLAKGQGMDPVPVAAVALAATAGHVFTPWLRFKGGKGVATALGTALAFHWLMVMPSMGVFVVVLLLSRYVSLGSILGAGLLPVALAMLPEPARTVVFKGEGFSWKLQISGLPFGMGAWPTHEAACLVMWSLLAGLVILKHHENIGRLLRGQESPLWGAKRGRQDA
jgi:glycerol-3-phosphate acyltransferase PlsY